ncbi:MAG: alcohol dehydrogenase catalytic domain-containing protein [Pseudomonadota bacterium]
MPDVPNRIISYQMVQPSLRHSETGKIIPGKFELVELPVPELKSGEVLVEIAGCGVSYEDLYFFHEAAPALQHPPLALGHEISGKVIAGEASWIGREVIIPAILPCRKCEACLTGKTDRCHSPIMPGNSLGMHGGFSSHIAVPCNVLCFIKNRRRSFPLEHLAVVPTVASAYRAVQKTSLQAGDNVIVIGVGGIGRYIVQMAKALGAGTVIAVDIVETRLRKMLQFGADVVIDVSGKEPEEAAAEVSRQIDEKGSAQRGWKIIEAAGSATARETAMHLLKLYVGKLVIVQSAIPETGYDLDGSMESNENIIRSWGCPPEYYPEVLEMVISGKIVTGPFIQTRPMSWIGKVFEESYHTSSDKRTILTTEDFGIDGTPETMGCR